MLLESQGFQCYDNCIGTMKMNGIFFLKKCNYAKVQLWKCQTYCREFSEIHLKFFIAQNFANNFWLCKKE